MKLSRIAACLPVFLMTCLVVLTTVAQDRSGAEAGVVVRVENPLPVLRQDEIVAVSWQELRNRLSAVREGNVRVRERTSGNEVVMQVVDADADGQPDDLLFLVTLLPDEVREYVVEAAPSALKPEPRTYAAHKPERDDMAWESDKIAFRAYGKGLWQTPDSLYSSGIDVWLKRVPYSVIDSWYAAGHDAYHTDTGEGADFYSVGSTLGAGGTAVWVDGQLVSAPNFSAHRIIANGPIRTIFELDYGPFRAGSLDVTEVKRFTVDAGQHLVRQESIYRAGAAREVPYVIGIRGHGAEVFSMSKRQPWTWISLWEPVSIVQGEGGHGYLGTAVMLEEDRILETRELDGQYVVVTTASPGEPMVHYIGAGWTSARDFETAEDWWAYLDMFAQRLHAPLQVTLK